MSAVDERATAYDRSRPCEKERFDGMTAADVLTRPTNRPLESTPTIKIGFERAASPDCLALVAADAWSLFAERNLAISLVLLPLPRTGIAALTEGDCELALIEPLQLLDQPAADLETLGGVVRVTGGLMMREDRLRALTEGDTLRIAAPVAGAGVTGLCRRMLQGWAARQGLAIAGETIQVVAVTLSGEDCLAAGYDGVWWPQSDAEGVATRIAGSSVRLIAAEDGGVRMLPGLELVARRARTAEESGRHEAVIAAIDAASSRLQQEPDRAVDLWLQYARTSGPDAEQVVRASLARMCSPLDRRPDRWRGLRALI